LLSRRPSDNPTNPAHAAGAGDTAAAAAPTVRSGLSFIAPETAAYKWWVAATVMLSAFLVVMNNATVNVALPPIMTAFGLNIDQVQWIVTAYMIAGAVMVPTVGWLGNVLGNRNLFLLSMLVFIAASALCGLAWSGSSLIVFRIIQGLGGGPITPMAMVFLNQTFPPHQRGLAMGLYGLGVSCGPSIGPVLGGYVTEYLNWRMVFYLNTIPGLVGMVLVLLVIPKGREAITRPLDVPGLITLTVFLVSLLIALSQGQRQGWDSPYIQRLFVTAGAAFCIFLGIELLRKDPLVELRLYKNLAFAAVSLVLFITAMTFWGTSFLQTFLLQRLLGYTPSQAGFAILPGALAMAVTTMIAGRLVDKVDRRYVVWGGLGMFILASYWFSFLDLDRPMSWMIWMIVGRYMTIGFIFTPMNAASLMVLPQDQVRMGSGLINLMQQGLGGTIGLAMMTTVLQRRTYYHSSLMAQEQVASALPWHDVMAPIHEFLTRAGEIGAMAELKAAALLHRHLAQQATVAAYQDCFLLVVVLCLVVSPLVYFLRRRAE
jgi:DHA2 family multidrug resistance protein